MTMEEVDMINDKQALALIRKKLGTNDLDSLKRFLATVPDTLPATPASTFVPVMNIEEEKDEEIQSPVGELPPPTTPAEPTPESEKAQEEAQ